MGRKKKNNDAVGIVYFIGMIVAVLVALATPIVILVGYLYNALKADSLKKLLSGNMSDFWLSEEEKKDFKEKLLELNKVNNIIEQANQKGIAAGVTRNKDGSFSAKSNLGKEIRVTLKQYEPIKASLSDDLYDLQTQPISDWQYFNGYIKKEKSFFWAFFAWFGTLLYYADSLGRLSKEELFRPYWGFATNFLRDETNKIQILDGDFTMLIVSALAAILAYYIFGFIFKNSAEKYSPRPEKVTLENIDNY